MADDQETDAKDVVARAKKRRVSASGYWQDIYDKARDDLKFLSDDKYAQWDAADAEARRSRGRPTLTIDQLTQFINQVSNNIRMSTPSINVFPSDGAAQKEIAEIYKGRIKDIEHCSGADDAYDYAVNSAIKCGIGFIRVEHDFKDNYSFEQDIRIKRVINPFSILIDPSSVEPDGSDAMYAIAIDEMTREAFKARFPGKEVSCFEDDDNSDDKLETVKVAEYFEVKETDVLIGMLPDGRAEEVQEYGQYIRTRIAKKREVLRYWLSGTDVLEETKFPGKFIPIIPVYGEEAWEGSERKLNSLIRRSRDAQRMFNFWKSTEAELLMRSPKAIAIAAVGTTEDFAEDWKNPEKAAVLRYVPKVAANGQFLPPPSLNQPPQIPAGIVNASASAQQDIRSTMGLYNAYLGQQSNETSGVAINARKIEGDRATFHFGDNLIKAITQVGRVVVSMIPVLDDTPKVVRIIGEDGETKEVGINGMIVQGQEQTFDLKRGEYSVRVSTGNDLPTMRQEFSTVMQGLIEKQPDLLTVFGDIFMENQDFPGAKAIAERLEKILRPELRDIEGQDPQTAALMKENQQLKAAIQELQQGDALKQQEMAADNAIEHKKLELQEAELIAEIATKRKELELKEIELTMKLAAQGHTASMVGQPEQSPLNGYDRSVV